jgi:predicted PurR-regulated permease PerM
LIDGKEIEKNLDKFIPLKPANITSLAIETKSMIKANALGIPAICFVQGVFAAIGFWIFGVEDWGMWGFFTGLFAFFPFIGTMAIWVPIVISIFISGDSSTGIGLTLYSLIITGNVDYLTRLLLMKKLVNVHPMITIFGVIVGLGLFGFMGIIFGPLLLSYLIVLVKIYINEFTEMR